MSKNDSTHLEYTAPILYNSSLLHTLNAFIKSQYAMFKHPPSTNVSQFPVIYNTNKRICVSKQPIIALYLEFETVLKFFNIEAKLPGYRD